MKKHLNTILGIIKVIWKERISSDYEFLLLHREDSFKNAFYYHLRTMLGQDFMLKHQIRVYTEFHYGNPNRPGERADIAIVQLDTDGNIKKVLIVLELKYKGSGVSDAPYIDDVKKVIRMIRSHHGIFAECQYILAFINENNYEDLLPEQLSYTNARQRKIATGRLTELLSYREDDAVNWYIIEH